MATSPARSAARSLYAALPFKQPLFQLVRRLAPPLPERLYRHLHFKGVITVDISPTERFRIRHHGYMIENELFWRGLSGWEKISMELWIRLCRRSRVILDIGANTGVYALAAKTVNPGAEVIAVEPVARIFDKLVGNIRLNGGAVKAEHAAATNHTGTVVLYDQPQSEHVLSVSLNPEWNKESPALRPVEVPAFTVADLLAKHGNTTVDLLKIDVETHEAEVLRGFREILLRDKPAMLIELLNGQVAADVGTLLEGLGYEYYNIDDVSWPPARAKVLAQSGHFNFLVCQPATARAIGL